MKYVDFDFVSTNDVTNWISTTNGNIVTINGIINRNIIHDIQRIPIDDYSSVIIILVSFVVGVLIMSFILNILNRK